MNDTIGQSRTETVTDSIPVDLAGRVALLVLALLGLGFLPSHAADKNGVSPSAISLPKGPGSIEGLGDSFQPTLNTGTARHRIGIQLPPGTAGHQPSLALNYDGGGANGPLGYGWGLTVPHIQRQTDKGIPTYGQSPGFPRTDRFVTESREELVPTEDGFFYCENESDFIRYRPAGDHWEATAPDGTRLEFGISTDARIADGARTFTWLLERETDTHGNVIEYTYRSFPGGQNLNQKYLAQIRYGPGAPPWSAFQFVAFEYEDRPDWFEDGRAGFLVRTGKRLRTIRVATQGVTLTNHLAGDFNADGIPDALNRRYDLNYLRYAGNASHWSLLQAVTVTGADGVTALPAATFDYAVSHPPAVLNASGHIWGATNAPASVMDNPQVDLIDLNADGLPDLLKTDTGGGHTVALNRGPVRQGTNWAIGWSAPVPVDPGAGGAWNFDLAEDQTHLADMDGDGLADLVHKTAGESVFYFANRGRLGWGERRDMATPESAPPAPFGNASVRTADVDFDKRIDVIQSVDAGGATAYRIWFNQGDQRYSAPQTVEPEGGFDLALPGVQMVDLNGDRVPDIARIQPGGVVVAAGLGYGHFAPPATLVLPDFTLDDAQIAAAKLADLNGDGLADLVLERAEPGVCWYWLNLGNYTLAERRSIIGLPAVASGAAVRWADLNGNGSTDLIYADSQDEQRLQFVEMGELLSGGLAPNLLTRIGNGIGRVTSIEYAPSTRFALEDDAAGRPWPDPLPFPVTVVAAVTVSDSLGHEYVTRYRYHNGFYDTAEKQFRGFGEVEQREIGDPSAPTLVSRSHFDTGRTFDAMKGRLLRSSVEAEDGAVFSREATVWADPPRLLRMGTNGTAIRFAHPTASVKEILERGAGVPRRLETESQFDDYGNLIRSSDYGIVENGDRSAFDDERITLTEFSVNVSRWILHAPKRQIVQDEQGAVISRAEMFYDDESFSGNNSGSVTVGNLTLRRDWFDPSRPDAYVNSLRTKYDRYGNAIVSLDPLADPDADPARGHIRELAYDAALHAYVEREVVHIGGGSLPLTVTATYDAGLSTVRSTTDFNGHITTYGYDALGRLRSLVKPGDTADFPSMEYDYALAAPVRWVGAGGIEHTGLVNHVETRLLDQTSGSVTNKREHYFISRRFTDGLGRALMTRTEAEPAEGSASPRVVVSGAVLFNARATPARGFNPFFTARSGSLDELLAFENVESPAWRGLFHDSGNLVSLNLDAAHQASTDYDAVGRTLRATNPDGTFHRTEYEPLVTREFDENDSNPASPHFNTPITQFHDGLGRLIRVDEQVRLNDDGTPSADVRTWTTRYRHDLNNQLTRITDSQNNVKELRYDALRRKVWMNDPDAGISTNRYDAASNVIETTDAKGQRVRYTYDGANRMLTEDYDDETSPEFRYHRSPDVIYHYDSPAGPVDQGDGTRATAGHTRGMLAWVEDSTGREHISYDARGRAEWTVKQIPDPLLEPDLLFHPTTAVSYKTAFDYDSLDRVTRMIYPDNDQVTYQYNARNLLESIGGGPGGHILTGARYLPSGQQERLDFGNGVRTRYDYDSRQRLSRLLTRHIAREDELVHFAYDLDPVSNIEAIHDQRPVDAVPLDHPRRNTQHFTYDSLYRLTRVQYNRPNVASANGGQIDYRYDRIANLLSQTSDLPQKEAGSPVANLGEMGYGSAAGTFGRIGRQPHDPPGPHALSRIQNPVSGARDFDYDANGNMTTIDGMRCTWDFRDRLVTVEDDTMRADYRYDYSGQRVIKRVTWKNGFPLAPGGTNAPAAAQPSAKPATTATLYPGDHFEVREHDEPTKYVFNGETRLARVTGSLSTQGDLRIQRLRLHAGWNLCSVAVDDATLANATANQPAPVLEAAYHRNPARSGWQAVSPGDRLESGSVLWLRAATNAMLAFAGRYREPASTEIDVGGSFFPGVGLAPLRLAASMPGSDPGLSWAAFDSAGQHWTLHDPSIPAIDADAPQILSPGQAIFVQATAPTELGFVDTALNVRYYHQDHLGSSSVITDAAGGVVEETAFHPAGVPRYAPPLRSMEEPYQFSQKERDRESGLHYFEARYLNGTIGRFASIDPKYLHPDSLSDSDGSGFLRDPQELNLYAYACNNPVRYSDPTGLDANEAVGWVNDAVGLAAGAIEEGDLWKTKATPLFPLLSSGASKAAGVVGKATAGVSVGMKAYDFAMDPSSATGGQLLNEGAKTLVGIVAAPVGLVWSFTDLIGYGPSQILESTEASIKANRAAAKAYRQSAATHRATAMMLNEAAPRLAGKLQHIDERRKVLERKTAELNATTRRILKGDTRSLEELNAEIRKMERANAAAAIELKRQQARLKKALAD